MELRHLRFFIALAEELNFGRAALRCNVTQPPFSVAIRQLESHLNVILVERNSRNVMLTPAGEALYGRMQRLMGQVGDAYELARCVSEGKRGKLRVGFHASMLYQGLSEMVQAMEQDEPLVEIELLEMATQDQVQSLLAGRIDVGFGHSTIVPASLSSVTILQEPLVVCVPPAHPALRAHDFLLDMLKDEGFICFWREASPIYFDRIVSLCVQAGFNPRIRHQVRQWTTVVAMVGKGMGVAIVPQCIAQSGLASAMIPLESEACTELQCMWVNGAEQPMVQNLLGYAKRHLRASSRVKQK
ncbi:LysR family transcriptional regulator [Advenella kashmirensis W13003]|uniref:LysR family transcriptional regulator n=1 Tax=Advenella kashmirensis W13003 TaxID=1424334 RepID=V8QZL0_9BURK|nr:LysR family transcriptional regulator [Advenella kashmirensis W13003]